MSSSSYKDFTISKPLPKFVPVDPAKPPPQLGSVPYLNARPLTYAIREPIALLEPSKLAVELAEGRLQAALVPLVEVLENSAAYDIVDGVAIGSLNSVYSVILIHTLPIVRLKSVALDPASKTSNELIKVLLEKYYGLKPDYVAAGEPADARLIIGDPALNYRRGHADERYLDLAQSWHSHTGLPFVFAVWAVHKHAPNGPALAKNLREAAKQGLKAREEIAKTHFEYRYLTEHLYYHLGDPQKKAIEAFATDLQEIGRLHEAPDLHYI